mmetsp:Transcript_23005/g.71547  ORF Transcript_23005/g.71547 Transcript_23005/m.71547 type:complete len:330 (+) Transcript_23005:348-1337(+)
MSALAAGPMSVCSRMNSSSLASLSSPSFCIFSAGSRLFFTLSTSANSRSAAPAKARRSSTLMACARAIAPGLSSSILSMRWPCSSMSAFCCSCCSRIWRCARSRSSASALRISSSLPMAIWHARFWRCRKSWNARILSGWARKRTSRFLSASHPKSLSMSTAYSNISRCRSQMRSAGGLPVLSKSAFSSALISSWTMSQLQAWNHSRIVPSAISPRVCSALRSSCRARMASTMARCDAASKPSSAAFTSASSAYMTGMRVTASLPPRSLTPRASSSRICMRWSATCIFSPLSESVSISSRVSSASTLVFTSVRNSSTASRSISTGASRG